MAKYSSIEWTTHTFNPWWGCTKVSEGCKHCYAELLAKRVGKPETWQGQYQSASETTWQQPMKWQRAALKQGIDKVRVFCASMGDIFDLLGDNDARARLFELTKATPNLFWLLLTKRPENIQGMLPGDWGAGYPNIGLGVTVENVQECRRAKLLSEIPAVMRFLSVEPMLEAIPDLPLNNIHWVILGGESGQYHRPFDPKWAVQVKDQCLARNIPFFYKQSSGVHPQKLPLIDGSQYTQVPDICGGSKVVEQNYISLRLFE